MFSEKLIAFFYELAEFFRFSGKIISCFFKKPFERKEFLRQSYEAGYKTFALVGITALILGMVLTLQTRPVLSKLGAEAWLPGMVFVSVVAEIGPVITALIFAGKVGSGIGAQLSSMRVTEQIDAMEVSGIMPMKFLASTRVLATTFMLPLLVIYADFISLIGAYIGVNIHDNVSFIFFFNAAIDHLRFMDIIPAILKTIFFGLGIGLVSCFKGYTTNKGTRGVGMAANSAVVVSSLVIFIIDLLAVQITDIISK